MPCGQLNGEFETVGNEPFVPDNIPDGDIDYSKACATSK